MSARISSVHVTGDCQWTGCGRPGSTRQMIDARARALLIIGSLATLILASLFMSTKTAGFDAPAGKQDLLVVRGSLDFPEHLMPGDQMEPQLVELEATEDLLYGLHASWSGSEHLAEAIHVVMSDARGHVLYEGPLATAGFGPTDGRPFDGTPLAAGERTTLTVTGELPITTGNDVQGATVRVEWTTTAVSQAGG